jgi:tRNA:m4X modification enzyme
LNYKDTKGAVIAVCCHQLLKRHLYIGDSILAKYGLTDDEFGLLVVLSTWKVCGIKDGEQDKPHWTGMTFIQRTLLGDEAKRVLDYGRLLYVKSQGYEARLVRYCNDETPENVCLLVWKP